MWQPIVAPSLTCTSLTSQNRMAKSHETLLSQIPLLKATLESGDPGEIEILHKNVSKPSLSEAI